MNHHWATFAFVRTTFIALCNKIAAHHGGEIYATAVENEGAEFFVILPLRQIKKG